MTVVDDVIETDVAEVFVDIRRARAGNDVLQRVRRGKLAYRESLQQRLDGRHSLRTGEAAEGALPESDINALEKILLAAEKEQLVLDNGAADGSAELVEPQGRLFLTTIEVVARVEHFVANVFEQLAMPGVRTGFGGDGDLPASTPSEFRRIGAGFDMKLLDVLETLRQAEL